MPRDLSRLLDAWVDGRSGPDEAAAIRDAAATCATKTITPQVDETLRRFLALSRRPDFLTAEGNAEARERWFDTALAVIDAIGFDLGDLLAQRTAEHPDRILFRTISGDEEDDPWSYQQVRDRVRSTAAIFWRDGPHPLLSPQISNPVSGPRVGLFCANSIGSACCDLACLTEGILVTPLNIQFKAEHLEWIFGRLLLTVAVCDSPERLDQLLAIRDKMPVPFSIYTLHADPRVGQPGIMLLDEEKAQLGPEETNRILADRPRRNLRDLATVMFTSGSTGLPKGVAFSQRNLVSKRFARAAALPDVGQDEVLLCYLPLFHTFGRFLEMLGSIFWGGTYVFAGNTAADSLMTMLARIRPTGLISVPVRWQQIADRLLQEEHQVDASAGANLRSLVGERLCWGISAAGYLDPKVFRFFHHQGIKLCSGFGMTEGTGGLTMTPPDDYVPNSVGIPLPGTHTRLAQNGELQVSGCYIARYLDTEGPAGSLDVEQPDSDQWWLPTGDLFRLTTGKHLEIVDRLKDIYKNNRGQTIAPRAVESLFEQVPGIKRTFLAGDGRAYNTLLIVPDNEDDVLRSLQDEEGRRHYFQHIISAANPSLSTWERVVNFTVLERDFSLAEGELTAKGSLRRKTIEQNFAAVIATLYRSEDRLLDCGEIRVRIPRWFFRDLGLIENAVTSEPGGLLNTETGVRLDIQPAAQGRVRIGNLEYDLEARESGRLMVDLGLFARQPLLWLANPALIRFSPCRPGWDTALQGVTEHTHLPPRDTEDCPACLESVKVPPPLAEANTLCTQALFGSTPQALEAVKKLGTSLENHPETLSAAIRCRLYTLANHPVHEVRCRTYQVLVIDRPHPDYKRYLPAFIESGLPFLDQESFQAISRASIQPHSLTALRKRLDYYRRHLEWPAPPKSQQIFRDLLRMLADFGRHHLEFYATIRAELACWIRHEADPHLAVQARAAFADLSRWFEAHLQADYPGMDPDAWQDKIAFQEGLNDRETAKLQQVLVGTTFLRESIMLAFEGEDIALQEIQPGGIWVSRIKSQFEDSRFRISINTIAGKHFDLQLIVFNKTDPAQTLETLFWYLVLRGHVSGPAVLPAIGASRPHQGALSMAYVSDLMVWEKVREFSSLRGPGTTLPSRMRWKQLMVRAMCVVVRGWEYSGRRIIPGLISPYNLIVPDPDFRTGDRLINLTGWRPYTEPLSLLRPLWRNMIHHTISHYPWSDFYLESSWLFDAVVEALGTNQAETWLTDLAAKLPHGDPDPDAGMWSGFAADLDEFLTVLRSRYHQPLVLQGAIQRYDEWDRIHMDAPMAARLAILQEVISLYHLDRLPEIARFTLYRHTIFLHADPGLGALFDRLLQRLHESPARPAATMVELSQLQTALKSQDDRLAFARMAFPHWSRAQTVEVKTLGDPAHHQVVVHSHFNDRQGRPYTVCEPTSPAEVGMLYRLFLQAGFPKSVSPSDRHLVVMDQVEQVVAGVVYRILDSRTVFLDGVVVSRALLERGIAAGVMNEYCVRMKASGVKAIRTHFFLRPFYEKHGFRPREDGTGLVRHL